MTRFLQRIQKNRERFQHDVANTDLDRYFSAETYAQSVLVDAAIAQFAHGKLLDVGCGLRSFENQVKKVAASYETFDKEARSGALTFQGDIQDMHSVPPETYDSVLCLEVLEHVPDPFQAVKELRRVLKKDGVLILSVPHISRLHEVPHDFFRFTSFGVRALLESAHFEVLEMHTRGGFFSFIGHQISTLLLGLTWPIPVIKHVAFFINRRLINLCCSGLDRCSGPARELFASGYVCVAKKKL